MSLFGNLGNWGVSQINTILTDPNPDILGKVTDAAGGALWGILDGVSQNNSISLPGILGGTGNNSKPATSGKGSSGAGLGAGALLAVGVVAFALMSGGKKRR